MKHNIDNLAKVLFSKLDTRKLWKEHYHAFIFIPFMMLTLIPMLTVGTLCILESSICITSIIGIHDSIIAGYCLTGLFFFSMYIMLIDVGGNGMINDIPYLTE